MSWINLFVLLISVTISFVSPASQVDPENDINKILVQRLDELERRIGEQRKETELLRTENSELKRLVEELELKKERDRLTGKDGHFTKGIEGVEDLIRKLISKLVQQRCDASKSEEEEGGNSIATNKRSSNRIGQLDQGSTIAFFASMSGSAEHLGQHQPIVFDRALTNVGQAYHNTTGIFIAPVSGIYVFSTTILTYKETAHFQFAVNGQAYSSMIAYSSETYETLSQTVIFNLAKGDDVAIQSYDSDRFVHGNHYSTFSGFLLAQSEGDLIVV